MSGSRRRRDDLFREERAGIDDRTSAETEPIRGIGSYVSNIVDRRAAPDRPDLLKRTGITRHLDVVKA